MSGAILAAFLVSIHYECDFDVASVDCCPSLFLLPSGHLETTSHWG